MVYKTRAQRREGGGYDFSFGTKAKKLQAVAEKVEGKWRITDGFGVNLTKPFVKLGELKVSWGEVAAISYGHTAPALSQNGPPSIRKGPPLLKPKPEDPVDHGPTCSVCERPVTGWFDDLPPCRCNAANDVGYTPDPFDPNMLDSSGGDGQRVSVYGALDMVYHWMMRNPAYVQTEGVMDSPWKEVQELLWRTLGYAEYRPTRFDALAEPGQSAADRKRIEERGQS